MSGVHGQMLGHLVRRGATMAQVTFSKVNQTAAAAESQQLHDNFFKFVDEQQKKHDNPAAPQIDPMEYLPAVIIMIVMALFIASVRYTVGEVIASLAMIESPSSTAFIESAPPAYADEPDFPLEKKDDMMPAEAAADQDIEITVIKHKPITASIKTSIRHLHTVGGFFGRWRGAGVGMVYHMLHGLTTNFLSGLIGLGLGGHALMHIVSSIALARVHMAWTHSMIAAPNATRKSWMRSMVPRKECKAILLPTVAFAVAQQVTILMPIAVAFALGLPQEMHNQEFDFMNRNVSPAEAAYYAFALLSIPLTAIFVALAILLPASVTLTRIEAALLPEDRETIVPFDRTTVLGDFGLQTRGACRSVFVQAWKSFEPAARLRLIKLYAKMFCMQAMIALVGGLAILVVL